NWSRLFNNSPLLVTPRSTGALTWSPFRSATTLSSVPIYWMSRSMLGFHWKRLSGYIPPRRISYISSDSLRVSFTSVGCRRFCTCPGSRLLGHPLSAEVSELPAVRQESIQLTLPEDGS